MCNYFTQKTLSCMHNPLNCFHQNPKLSKSGDIYTVLRKNTNCLLQTLPDLKPLHWWEPLHLICKWQKEPSLKKSKCDAIIFIALMISSRISECDWFVKVMEIGFVPTSLLSDSISFHKASRRWNNLKKFDKYKRWSE